MDPKAITIALRPATEADIAFLSQAHRQGHEIVRDTRGGNLDTILRGRPEPIDDSFSRDLLDPAITIMIGEIDSIAVGYMVTELRQLRSEESISVVTDLWVLEGARGVGVGGALMTSATEAARSAGCVGIDARALPGDRVTKNFFESFGLVARTIEVHKSL